MEEAIEPSVQETESTGLLDGASPEVEEASTDTNQVEIDHRDPEELKAKEDFESQNEDDDPLERPDWWPENFWKGEEAEPDLEAIAKSWTDLRKQISQGLFINQSNPLICQWSIRQAIRRNIKPAS